MAEKTEKATPKKLRDARKKGQVAKSQDFPSALTFVVSIMGTLFASSFLYDHLSTYIISMLRRISGNINLEQQGGAYILEAIQVIAIVSLPIVVVVACVGVITNFLIIGPVFSFEAMKFNFKKLNPVEGIKQKFKLKTLFELVKSIFKITGAAIIIFYAIWKAIPEVVQASSIPVIGSALILESFLKKISIQVGIFFLAIAIFDLLYQKRTFAKEMMMEKFEVKQEYKDTEGNPEIKGKRRERFREIAYSEGPSAAGRAKAIVTNPTHIAVAIGFEEGRQKVPVILTMGINKVAEKIITIGTKENVPIMRNVELARQLYNQGSIGSYIPKETYKAVAEVLKWIEQIESKPKTTLENL
ncbi:MAG TPA: type III secretion system export apparatus subunit SctU [Chlamydiales bacterium]|nr:type III secretion system export apparatus subunit SctU [Chlamydiales bacterium]